MNKADWDDICKWGRQEERIEWWRPTAVELAPLKLLRDPPTRIERVYAHIEVPPGLVPLDVLIPQWGWQGDPPVLQMRAVGWRAWEDLQIARELERQILQKGILIGVDWETQSIAQSVMADSFLLGVRAFQRELMAALQVPAHLLMDE